VDFSLDQRLDTFMRMHERAFAFFGGIGCGSHPEHRMRSFADQYGIAG
jgi:hypothetical protein